MAKFYSLQFGSGDPRTFTGLSPTFLIFVRMTDGQTIAPPSITEALASSGLYQFSYGVTQPIAFLADAATTSPGTAGRYIVGQIDPVDRMDEVGTTLVALGTTNVALGTTNVALGTTNVALGTTSVALGITNFALGTTNIAFGTTNVALGTSIYALEQQVGTTLLAIGNSLIAQGNTILSLAGAGASLVPIVGSTASLIGDSSTSPSDLFGYLKRVREVLEGRERFIKSTGALTIYDRTGATTLVSQTVANNASLVTKT